MGVMARLFADAKGNISQFTKEFLVIVRDYLVLPILTAKDKTVFTANLKDLVHYFALEPVIVEQIATNVHDMRIVGYCRNSNISGSSALYNQANYFLNLELEPIKYTKILKDYSPIVNTSKSLTLYLAYFAQFVESTFKSKLYVELEQELWKYLYTMEINGIKVDISKFKEIEAKLEQQIDQVLAQIQEIAGYEINPKSAKQVAQLLYEELGLPDIKNQSTSAEVLAQLDHKVAQLIIDYRSLTVILSTHVQSLLSATDSKSHKIHTQYQQCQAVTGRLSSTDPNLQNVPSRGEFAHDIRSCFIAQPGYKIVSLDYSQIELRVLAYFSREQHMIDAFAQGKDIHRQTATKLFKVESEKVTFKQRQIAKAINFGLNYGKTAFSLAQELDISRGEAKEFIDDYFATYPTVQNFIQNSINLAESRLFVETLYGRIIPLKGLESSQRIVRDQERRNSTNYPIQGSASEIIKFAMNSLYRKLAKEMPEVIAHLQIHDELVFSIPEHLVDKYVPQIQEIMTNLIDLSPVVLQADFKVEDYWSK